MRFSPGDVERSQCTERAMPSQCGRRAQLAPKITARKAAAASNVEATFQGQRRPSSPRICMQLRHKTRACAHPKRHWRFRILTGIFFVVFSVLLTTAALVLSGRRRVGPKWLKRSVDQESVSADGGGGPETGSQPSSHRRCCSEGQLLASDGARPRFSRGARKAK
jgi:hypothetical protein